MPTMLKRTTVVLSILVVVELVALGNLVSSDQGFSFVKKTPALAVSDLAFTPPAFADDAAPANVTKQREELVSTSEEPEYSYGVYSDTSETIVAEQVWSDTPVESDWQAEQSYYGAGSYAATPSYDGGGFVDANVDDNWIAGSDFKFSGVHQDSSGYSYTYYSENVLPGGGLNIPGRHVGDEGYVMDGDNNLCVASSDLPYGTVVKVPFGTGTAVVYDSGCSSGVLDVYVSW